MQRPCFVIPAMLALLMLFGGLSSAQTIEERITSLINQMTTQEKILQLNQQPDAFSTAENVRLGIPGFTMADGPHGVREGVATSFPVGIGMAATWDPELARRVGIGMGKEFRGKGKYQALGPCLDLDRDPRNGRSPESGGEDPYLCAKITTAVVQGIQATGCIATVKHYNANHREEGRTTNNIIITRRGMEEHNGLAFRMAVQDGGAFSVMNAYNQINGQWCGENRTLLTSVLRQDWGFPYYVVSDWGSLVSAERAIKAGCDICMGADNYKNDLPGLVSSGAVSQAVLDSAVRRVLRTKFVSGMMYGLPSGDPADVGSAENQVLCLEAGRKSLVLLKNQGNILPLSSSLNSVALIGPNAADLRTDASGSSWVTPVAPVSPKSALEQRLTPARVNYAKGCDINSTDTSGFAAARSAAASADVVIFCGGLDGSQEGEGFDRVGKSITLPGRQQSLINAVAAVNPNVVVVLFSGGICGIEQCVANIKGLIYAFYPGEKAGTALTEVLFGDVNPSGKLPVTMPTTDAQLPAWNDDFTDDVGGGYRWFDAQNITPRFPFGYGLSYTTFSYSNVVVAPSSVAPGQPVKVSVDVTNTGSRSGDEVAELYLSHANVLAPLPVKQLKGFQRVTLAAGETKTVTFTLTADEMYYYDEGSYTFDVYEGDYIVRIGGSSATLPVSGTFTVNAGPRKPELYVTTLRMVPPFPAVGDSVTFLAAVKNRGTAAVPAGTPLKVLFTINGQPQAWSTTSATAIPAGGMALFEANGGPSSDFLWRTNATGTYPVSARIDPDNAVDEFVEDNNELAIQANVRPRPPKNFAYRQAVTVSSVERSGLEGTYAVDGNSGSRWSSQFSDPQWISVDMGSKQYVDHVILRWEAAYGREYILEYSDDGVIWSIARHETAGNGGNDTIPVNTSARHIRMLGLQRGTQYGYSLYEFEIYGEPTTEVDEQTAIVPQEYGLSQNWPNPWNPVTTIGYTVAGIGDQGSGLRNVKLTIYSVLGQEVAVLVNEKQAPGRYTVRFEGSKLASGVYLYRLQAGNYVETKRMVLLK